jgi:hypothetical protein
MDTKTLYDWAAEAGLTFDTDDSSDAITVWISAMLSDSEVMEDYWLDALADMFHVLKDSDDQTPVARRDRMFDHVGRFASDLESLERRYTSDRVTSCYGTSLAYHAIQVGEEISLALLAWVTKHVEENADDWWGEVIGYHSDMMEGQYEDYRYEQWKDRQLEDRE